MSTNFFERQSKARRSTKWLVVMFLLAVLGIVACVFAVTAAGNAINKNYRQEFNSDFNATTQWTLPIVASVGTLILIAGGSWFKIAQLSGGGTIVAENVGGRQIATNTTDPIEKRLLNVVEEMALASGVPVPPVYFLAEEQGINAFAAGYSPSDAVVAVTRGTAEQLSRDQLQGVIAHEFSHILNGDMRLNIRLIGVLHGILLLSLVGRALFHIAASTGRSRSKNNPGVYFVLLGLVMLVLGIIGSLMGNLIKAAVSRQREYLADASAVQFTRDPGGIAGALKQIGAALVGSRLQHPNAAEMSHMYFGQGVWQGFSGLMATHPPLSKRILCLEPNWDGKFPKSATTPAVVAEIPGAAGFIGRSAVDDRVSAGAVEDASRQVGNPTEDHRRYAQELIAAIPDSILDAVRDPYGARAVLFALLLDRENKSVRAAQMSGLQKSTTPDIVDLTTKLTPAIDQLDPRVRLPLIDLAMPALRSMVRSQYVEFSEAFQELVQADDRIGLFEWTLHRILLRHLRPQFEKTAAPKISYYGLQRLSGPCSVLLSVLAYAGNNAQQAAAALAVAARHLPKASIHLLPPEACGLLQMDDALNELTRVAAKHRQRLINACTAAVCADEVVKIREAELLRGIADMLDCPMPPLLPGQPLSAD